MYENGSIVVYGNKVFIVTNPYMMMVVERTRDGRTLKRIYRDPGSISEPDRQDFMLARIIKNMSGKTK